MAASLLFAVLNFAHYHAPKTCVKNQMEMVKTPDYLAFEDVSKARYRHIEPELQDFSKWR